MAPAIDGLHDALNGFRFADPAFPVIANASGEPVRTGTDAKRLLVDQLTAPLRWVACMREAAVLAPGATFVELGPGNVLSGLVKRILPGVTTVTLGTAAEVEQFLA
jgi:[acyl-carrier-protein] S-malonyltransferase